MFKIQTFNKISPQGLGLFTSDAYTVAPEMQNPDAILVRSHTVLPTEIPQSVKAIARAGTGVNTIPVTACTEKGIVVFNTPGANANSVKELVLAALLLSSRKIVPAIISTKELAGKGGEVPKLVEKMKSSFAGPEIKGKTLGVIGLGSIGSMVANDALALGMNVIGYDPYISIEAAWRLSGSIKKADKLKQLLNASDYITLHVPLSDSTRGMLDYEKFSLMKKGVRLVNFARGELVNNKDLIRAVKEGIVAAYITDFPDDELLATENVLCIPHLGASTPESEENCAFMAVSQLRDFLENGNVKNSVNFPECELARSEGNFRIVFANKNSPNLIGQIAEMLTAQQINIAEMINKHRGDLSYNIIDTDREVPEKLKENIGKLVGIIMVRCI